MIQVKDIIQCSQKDAKEILERWRENGVAGVICVSHNTELVYDPWLPLLRMAQDDQITPDRAWWDPVLSFYDWARKKGKVLVHCQAGANRSRGTAGVLLVARHQMTPQDALAIVGRPGYGAWIRAVEEWKA